MASLQDFEQLSDTNLRYNLLQLGINCGPVTATTRSLYIKKLRKSLGNKSPLASPKVEENLAHLNLTPTREHSSRWSDTNLLKNKSPLLQNRINCGPVNVDPIARSLYIKKLHKSIGNEVSVLGEAFERLRLQRALSDQQEPTAYRKQSFEEEIKEKDLQITQLQATLSNSPVSQQRLEELETENRQLNERLTNQEASSSALTSQLSERSALYDDLQRRFESAEQQIVECCVCLEQKPDIVFFPCHHVCVCNRCFTNQPMSNCPTCRARLVHSLKIFL